MEAPARVADDARTEMYGESDSPPQLSSDGAATHADTASDAAAGEKPSEDGSTSPLGLISQILAQDSPQKTLAQKIEKQWAWIESMKSFSDSYQLRSTIAAGREKFEATVSSAKVCCPAFCRCLLQTCVAAGMNLQRFRRLCRPSKRMQRHELNNGKHLQRAHN
eukprot:2488009-Pleurochrysis_carterae.AAC.1